MSDLREKSLSQLKRTCTIEGCKYPDDATKAELKRLIVDHRVRGTRKQKPEKRRSRSRSREREEKKPKKKSRSRSRSKDRGEGTENKCDPNPCDSDKICITSTGRCVTKTKKGRPYGEPALKGRFGKDYSFDDALRVAGSGKAIRSMRPLLDETFEPSKKKKSPRGEVDVLVENCWDDIPPVCTPDEGLLCSGTSGQCIVDKPSARKKKHLLHLENGQIIVGKLPHLMQLQRRLGGRLEAGEGAAPVPPPRKVIPTASPNLPADLPPFFPAAPSVRRKAPKPLPKVPKRDEFPPFFPGSPSVKRRSPNPNLPEDLPPFFPDAPSVRRKTPREPVAPESEEPPLPRSSLRMHRVSKAKTPKAQTPKGWAWSPKKPREFSLSSPPSPRPKIIRERRRLDPANVDPFDFETYGYEYELCRQFFEGPELYLRTALLVWDIFIESHGDINKQIESLNKSYDKGELERRILEITSTNADFKANWLTHKWYEHFAPDKLASQPDIAGDLMIEFYECHDRLFNVLYKKYVDPDWPENAPLPLMGECETARHQWRNKTEEEEQEEEATEEEGEESLEYVGSPKRISPPIPSVKSRATEWERQFDEGIIVKPSEEEQENILEEIEELIAETETAPAFEPEEEIEEASPRSRSSRSSRASSVRSNASPRPPSYSPFPSRQPTPIASRKGASPTARELAQERVLEGQASRRPIRAEITKQMIHDTFQQCLMNLQGA